MKVINLTFPINFFNDESLQSMSKKTANQKDWLAIEVDYRAGFLSLVAIGEKHNVTPTRISQVTKRDGWRRDINAKVKLKAAEKLKRAEVKARIIDADTQEAIAEKSASLIASVELSQRDDIKTARDICMGLFEELSLVSSLANSSVLRDVGDALKHGDSVKVENAYFVILSLPNRVKMMTDLANALKTLVTLERTVYNITGEQVERADPLTDLLDRVSGGNSTAALPVTVDPDYQ